MITTTGHGNVVMLRSGLIIKAHNLGSCAGHLETAVRAAVEKEFEEKRKLKSAKSMDVREKW